MPDESVPCPGCAAPMSLDQEICGACRRPRDEIEIQKGYDLIRDREQARRRRPYVIARWAAAAAAVVLSFLYRGILLDRIGKLQAEYLSEKQTLDRPTQAPRTAAGAAIVDWLGGQPAVVPSSAAAPVSTAPPAVQPRITVRPDPPEDPSGPLVRLYGVIYDLTTLQPVSGAAVNLTGGARPDGSGNPSVGTDVNGHYQIDFFEPANAPEILVSVMAAGYRPGQLEDLDPPYLSRTPKERLDAVAETSPSDLDAAPVRHAANSRVVEMDFVLVPQ